MTKPILKWVGGKTQIINAIVGGFPRNMNNYHEIFLGGGSVLFELLEQVNRGAITVSSKIYAYDVNMALIYVYKNIQTYCKELYQELQSLIGVYNNIAKEGVINRTPTSFEEATVCKENYYYWMRRQYNGIDNKTSVYASALFIFLNKTCFRGVFRVGPNGFNVPYGHYENPEIINEDHLNAVSTLIQNVVFECCDFTQSIAKIATNDFAYLDPPYAPETGKSFVGYTENGFDIETHKKLFGLINTATSAGKKMMMSNADVDLVSLNFAKENYKITRILCKRTINSKNPDAKAKEVIITNY